MGVQALTNQSALLTIGDRWVIEVETTNDDGLGVAGVPTVVVTLPGGTSSTLETERVAGAGTYRAVHVVASAGRYVAVASTADYGSVHFAAYAAGPTTEAGMPTTGDVATYLREGAASWDTEDLQDALDAETAAQRSVCRIRAVYPADMRQALLRRVARNLAMRQLPLAMPTGDAESGPSFIPGRDPEVRRLEGPHRKLVIG